MLSNRRLERTRREAEDLVLAGRDREAEDHISRALKRHPNDSTLHLLLARALMDRDAERAIRAACRAVECDPQNALIVLDAAWILLPLDSDRGRELGALAAEFKLGTDVERGLLAYLRGQYSLLDRDPEAAEAYFREATAFDPASQVFVEALIDLLADRGMIDEARDISDGALGAVHRRDRLEVQRERLGF